MAVLTRISSSPAKRALMRALFSSERAHWRLKKTTTTMTTPTRISATRTPPTIAPTFLQHPSINQSINQVLEWSSLQHRRNKRWDENNKNVKKRKKWRKWKKNVCKRCRQTLPTFWIQLLSLHTESYVGCQIPKFAWLQCSSASKIFCSIGYVTNQNQ